VKAARFLTLQVVMLLATLLAMAVGAAGAQAQSPLMYYPPPYAPRTGAYAYPATPYYPPPAPRRQAISPRVIYVPAAPTPWLGETIVTPAAPPTLDAAPLPARPAPTSPAREPSTPKTGSDPFIRFDSDGNAPTGKTPAYNKPPVNKIAQHASPSAPANTSIGSTRKSEIIISSTDATPESAAAFAADACPPPAHHDDYDPHKEWLPRCCCTLQIMSGYYANISGQNYDWIPVQFRFGRIWNCELLHGAFEPMLDLTGGVAVNNDFGDWFIGPSFILRYNFAQPGTRFIPYIQAGVGFQYNDAYRDANSPIGSRIELTAQAQAGFRIFLCDNFSFDFEGGVQHISNGGLSDRDADINALGATVGFSYFFGHSRH
jgi:hypothetical protein